jgi:cation diffusion facilitator family transporter
MHVTVAGLFVFKVVAGVITDSISIWAQAADSSLDIFAVVITFLTVGYSVKPADQEHPFGHGKAEDIAAAIQSILLLVAAAVIIYSAVRRMTTGTTIELTEAGIAVMAVSLVASLWLSRHLFRVARESGSVALEANANNIMGDIYSTAGVLVGLVIVRVGRAFGVQLDIMDPILAILVSALILRATYRVGWMAVRGLTDVRLPKEEEELLMSLIMEHTGQFVGVHRVRTRHSGRQHHVDLHMVMPKGTSVEQAHSMCDHLEEDIEKRLTNTSVTIHVEPCDTACQQCAVQGCDLRAENAARRV